MFARAFGFLTNLVFPQGPCPSGTSPLTVAPDRQWRGVPPLQGLSHTKARPLLNMALLPQSTSVRRAFGHRANVLTRDAASSVSCDFRSHERA
jgi:hypothetical protein